MTERVIPPNPALFDQIGETPLVPIELEDGKQIWCKLEFVNPSGSVKDRIARNILQSAWRKGKLRPGSVVVEASSGSTSIALALACNQMGLKFYAVLPEGASKERQWTIIAYGGQIETVPGEAGIDGAQARAREIEAETGGFYSRQFENEDNFLAHEETAREILKDIPDRYVDAFVSGVGTGGTLVGVHKFFSEHKLDMRPSVVRVPDVRILHDIGFTPKGFECLYTRWSRQDPNFADQVREVEVEESAAIQWTEYLWKKGFPVGPASGVNFGAAVQVARDLPEEAHVVTVFTDRMERYFSTRLFEEIKTDNEKLLEQRKKQQFKQEIIQEIKRTVAEEVKQEILKELRSGKS